MGNEAEFPAVEILAALSAELLDPAQRELVEQWHTLSAELQLMVPHLAELIVKAIGGDNHWRNMTASKRNIIVYSVVTLLAEARKRSHRGVKN